MVGFDKVTIKEFRLIVMGWKNKIYLSLITVIMIMANSSCTKEDMSNCKVVVGFIYDYNILSANALENQADQVNLYVFGEDNILVQQCTSGSESLTNDFNMKLLGLKAGKYRFVAWAKSTKLSNEQADFKVPSFKVNVSSINDLIYVLKRESGIQQHELNNMLVGVTEAEINYDKDLLNVSVNLKKVNHKIRIVILPVTPEAELDVADYEFSVIDKSGNGRINYDYNVLPDEQIIYRPYYAANLELDDIGIIEQQEINKAAVVEINTSRIMEANAPRLHIVKKANNKEIVSLNLPKLFSLTKMEDHREWSLQEYLDRQDSYTITLFFNNDTWMSGVIIINGWVINETEIDL